MSLGYNLGNQKPTNHKVTPTTPSAMQLPKPEGLITNTYPSRRGHCAIPIQGSHTTTNYLIVTDGLRHLLRFSLALFFRCRGAG